MNRFLVKLILVLTLSACASGSDIEVTNFSLSDNEECSDYDISRKVITDYFDSATLVSSEKANREEIVLPCSVNGALISNGQAYLFELNSGGTGYWYNRDGWVVNSFQCQGSCCEVLTQFCLDLE